MTGREEIEAALRAVGGRADAQIELGDAALTLAALDRPGVSLDRYRHQLGLLAAATAETYAAIDDLRGARRCHAALTRTIVDRFAYAGDRQTYDNL